MSYRCFKRTVWRRNAAWPAGFEPQAMPMDECRTLATFDTSDEAVEWCTERNDDRPKRGDGVFTAPYYEWTKL